MALTWADGVATITLNRSALGGTGKFSFQFSALSGIDPSTDNMDNVVSDDAPNDGFYSFDTGLQPIAQPVATRLLVTDSLLVPAKPKAGKAAVFAVLLRTDVDTVPTDGSVTCRATAGKKALKAKIGTMIEDGAACGWMIPKGTKGKMLRGSITVKAGGLAATKGFSARIR